MEDIAPKVPTSFPFHVEPVFEQPEVVLFRQRHEYVEITRNPHRVRDKDGARFRSDGGFDLRNVDIINSWLAVDKNGHEAVLHQRGQSGWKCDRRRDDLITTPQTVLDLRA
jgi:hypothetical protein